MRVAERRRVYDELRAAGIGVQVHYVPVHHHPVGACAVRPPEGLPTCDDVYEQVLSLPMYPDLTDEQVDEVVDAVERVVCADADERAGLDHSVRRRRTHASASGHVMRCLSLAEPRPPGAGASDGQALPEPLAERACASGVALRLGPAPRGASSRTA